MLPNLSNLSVVGLLKPTVAQFDEKSYIGGVVHS